MVPAEEQASDPNATDPNDEYHAISQSIESLFEHDDFEAKVDKVYKRLKLQNNRLQDIKVRRPSKYTESTLEMQLKQEQLVQQFLDEIEQMTEAWIANPKLKNETQKKAFLTDMVFKSKTIGIGPTVDCMLPCLVGAYNSD